jgi:hypothetical protein
MMPAGCQNKISYLEIEMTLAKGIAFNNGVINLIQLYIRIIWKSINFSEPGTKDRTMKICLAS